METEYIKEEIARCECIDDLKERIFPLLKTQQAKWALQIRDIIQKSGYSKQDFSALCGVSRVTLDKWCKGSVPRNRETFLKIGMIANYNLSEMNLLLQRYGRYPGLYSKSLEDCICIFVINNNFGAESINKYNYILKKIKANIIRDKILETEEFDTLGFDEKLSDVKDEDALEQFIEENITIFATAYHRFYAYVNMYINTNYSIQSNSIADMAAGQGWSSSLRQCVSAIRQKKWYPTRNKIISLGLHFSMDHDEIDKMLELAHMESLCAKNILESVIMFILDDASLNNMLDVHSDGYDQDGLCNYAREVLTEMNLPEAGIFLTELPEIDDE